MHALNIQNEDVYFRDIKPGHLPEILKWYNKVEDFRYATGIDEPINLDTILAKYAEVAICSNEFFVGIYSKLDGKMIGILKGSIRYRRKDTAWISSIAIDTQYQGKGYGTTSLRLLSEYLSTCCGIKSILLAVIEENLQGKNFWESQNFREVRRVEKWIKWKDRKQNILVMLKEL